MKKIAGVSAFLLGISFVSAGPVEGLNQLLVGLRQMISILIQFLFGLSYDLQIYNEFLFAKIILMILIFIIVYTVSKESIFKGYADDKGKPLLYIVSGAVAILSIKYLPDNMIQAILLPYSSLGVGLTVFLPLMIYFFFLHQSKMGIFGRRAGWVIFGASFLALWSTRYDLLGEANWIYWIGIAFIVCCFLFDNRIHKHFGLYGIKKLEAMSKEKLHRHWKREKFQLEEDYRNGHLGEGRDADAKYNREKAILDERIRKTAP